ncbi:hypothetical protein OGAPHI_003204 [Ogataea philodendri]|uniref:ERCC4 domain-containing protein n=1 Tax=Ogataea philodendri TaxID=1378263 RepID=A0A9P8T657_9ASCO|nr:uncharacterized protein OGAPHI_003204 [Ogataea philodendri]KAH3666755.1 hypothetical protein OGAPHI_003204 [Ogataea philodendri]
MSDPLFEPDSEEERVENELTELLRKDAEDDEELVIPVVAKDGPEQPRQPDTRPIFSMGNRQDRTVNLSLSLNFQRQIVKELVQDDGLVVLGKGLGLETVVANLLHVLSLSVMEDKKSLILLVNASDFESYKIGEELRELAWLDGQDETVTFVSVSRDPTTLDKRRRLYEKGGILSISTRILVTDFLGDVLDPDIVTGVVFLHAERVKEYSTERFVANLYRRKNKWGFLKAFSDEPERMGAGFQPLYTRMKYLRLQKVMLWPRFHVEITSSLKSRKVENKVTEVNVRMTSYMVKIQTGLMACMEACINELRRHNPEISSDYWAIENCLDDEFVKNIRAALDPYWHRVSYTTKQVLFDFTTLRDLLGRLFTWDAVQFYQELSSIVEANKPSVTNNDKRMAPWLLLDEAMTVISCAKARVFDKVREDDNEMATYLLEELPKWEQLAMILDDINDQKEHGNHSEDGPVLIMCSTGHCCNQLSNFLLTYKEYREGGQVGFSGRRMMVRRFKDHLAWKKGAGSRNLKIQKELNKAFQQQTSETAPETEESGVSRTFIRRKAPPTKRRRARGGAVITSYNKMLSRTEGESLNEEAQDAMVDLLETQLSEASDDEVKQESDDMDDFEILSESTTNHTQKGLIYEYVDRSEQVIIEKFDAKSSNFLLEEIMPSYIILYEPDLGFIRKVELFQSLRHTRPAKCYFMYYGDSIEEQGYLNSIKKEKDAFTKLIREKSALPKTFITDEDESARFLPTISANTRIAGGNPLDTKNKVVVDVREFRSQLPFLCYLAAMEVIPCMLTVGDYILSPKICIERKSIPDLIGSLKSGRLYQQCEQMFRYYELPTLLIEFEEGKSFSLEPFSGYKDGRGSGISGSVNTGLQQDLQLKLMMLLIAFPSLKIIWTSSPFETARVFRELKLTQEEPDVDRAISAGLNPMFDKDTYFNDMAIDLIQNIPGISSVNVHLIINKVRSLRELSQMTREQLAPLIGQEAAGKRSDSGVEYFGPASNFSLMSQLNHYLRQVAGSHDQTDKNERLARFGINLLVLKETAEDFDFSLETISFQTVNLLLTFYLETWHVAYPVFIAEDLFDLSVQEWKTATDSPHSKAILYLVLSIGAASAYFEKSADGEKTLSLARGFFILAQSTVPHIFTEVSFDAVQVLFLMSLSAANLGDTSQSYLYIGYAVRVATAIGLHQTASHESARQSRVWICVWHWEKFWGCYIGRPSCCRDENVPDPPEESVFSAPGYGEKNRFAINSNHMQIRRRFGTKCSTIQTELYYAKHKGLYGALEAVDRLSMEIDNDYYSTPQKVLTSSDLDAHLQMDSNTVREWFWIRTYYLYLKMMIYKPFLIFNAYLAMANHQFNVKLCNRLRKLSETCVHYTIQLADFIIGVNHRVRLRQPAIFLCTHLEATSTILLFYIMTNKANIEEELAKKIWQVLQDTCLFVSDSSGPKAGSIQLIAKDAIESLYDILEKRQAISTNFDKLMEGPIGDSTEYSSPDIENIWQTTLDWLNSTQSHAVDQFVNNSGSI